MASYCVDGLVFFSGIAAFIPGRKAVRATGGAARNLYAPERLNSPRPLLQRHTAICAEANLACLASTTGMQFMTTDPDPFERGERAARKNIPAEANPYQDGSDEHALWAAGHEKEAGEMEARQSEGN
ncbi:MAG: hypothetical protein Q7J60_06290 [Bradyrhizobium sp.]|nr:hypothetical protein [Bradyrhizobium sp.]